MLMELKDDWAFRGANRLASKSSARVLREEMAPVKPLDVFQLR